MSTCGSEGANRFKQRSARYSFSFKLSGFTDAEEVEEKKHKRVSVTLSSVHIRIRLSDPFTKHNQPKQWHVKTNRNRAYAINDNT